MNKFVLVSDIHGNAPALEAVVERESTELEYMVLGDIHGLNGYPKETLELVRSLDGFVLAGNHDKAIFQYGEGHVNSDALSEFELQHTLSELNEESQEYMRDRPYMEVVQRGGNRICLCHAMPWPEKASGYEMGNIGMPKRDIPRYASMLSDDYDYVFHGHTHQQYSLDCEQFSHDVHFVNPGTLGYDDNYAVVDTDSGEVELKSVEYEERIAEHVQPLLPDDAPHTGAWL